MAQTAFLFPGQGAQCVTMGQDLCDASPAAAALFDRAEAATGLPIRQLCFEGPEDVLSRTDNTQPCIFTVSAAILAMMQETLGEAMPAASVYAGLSLGEYTALYAAGAMDFETGVKLVAKRGELMQQAATDRPSGMVAVIGLDEDKATALCDEARQDHILTPANFNCPGQIVLSGENEACQRAADLAEKHGAMNAVVLKVAGAFHSEIMAPAAEAFASVLADVDFQMPTATVLANVDAQPYSCVEDIPTKLIAQLTGAVRWQQCCEAILAMDAETTPYEIGPGKTLMGMMRRVNRKCRVTVLNSAGAVNKLKD
ncbi:MAG: ACP S-malonyltransferase [Phycisphaerales bacterium]|jgi:[acyl-carrier-protein] S-malonyltransferase|nr:ACP S-malonyltransferase [Phycisphaerales bacterium]MBT7170193.1 ACP S-malonyltransferase [Phycisphaerales bacterium]